MTLLKLLLIWLGSIVLVVLTSSNTPSKYKIFSRESPLFWWTIALTLIAILYALVGIGQKLVGCPFIGECYEPDLSPWVSLAKLVLVALANLWMISVLLKVALFLIRCTIKYFRK